MKPSEIFSELYPNKKFKKKLVIIIDYWFHRFDFCISLLGNDKLKDIEEIINNNKNISFIQAKNAFLDGQTIIKNKKVIINSLLQFLLFSLYKFGFLKTLIIPGGETKFFKFQDLISNFFVRAFVNNKLKFNKTKCNFLKEKFIIKLQNTKNYNKIQIEFINKFLPLIYFYTENFEPKIDKLYVYGSLDNFLDDPNYINLFYYCKNIELIGTMHGSGYGQFYEHINELYEKKLSDKFEYWFPLGKSDFIGRFSKKIKNKFFKKNKKKIYWIGNSDFNEYEKVNLPTQYLHQYKINHLEHIDDLLCTFKNSYYVRGKNKRTTLWNIKKTNLFKKKGKIENYINVNNDIIIFSCISSTVLYFALKFNIPFIIIINEKSSKEIIGITDIYQKFCYKLERNNFLFNYKDMHKVFEKLSNLHNKKSYLKDKNIIINLKKFRYY